MARVAVAVPCDFVGQGALAQPDLQRLPHELGACASLGAPDAIDGTQGPFIVAGA